MADVPLDQVMGLLAQGRSDDEIVAQLTAQGFPSNDVFSAINQAKLKSDIGGMPPPPGMAPPPGMGRPGLKDASLERIEEIAEAIIDEKWDELVSNVTKIVEWKDKVEGDITTMKEQMKQIEDRFKSVQSSIIGKVEDYDRAMKDVGTDVKALTKVFQKILPGFTENVNELSRISQRFKGGMVEEKEEPEEEEEEEKKPTRFDEMFAKEEE